MKIAFLSRYQGKTNRGVETYVAELSKRLSKNHEVVILSAGDADNLEKILNGRFDIVIPTNGRLQALKAGLGRPFGRYKRSFTTYKVIISGQAGIGKDDIWNIFVCRPNAYIALTDYEEDWAKKWVIGTKIVKIPNGVDLEKFKPTGEKTKIGLPSPIILSVGALEWYKHHELTIKVMENVEGSLLIVGKGSEQGRLEKLANQKIPKRFKIISANYKDLPKIYRTCDLFVLPSWDREAFGIVYVEAMASGLPVVAPDDSPRREIVGESGILVDVEDSEKYARAIEEALKRDWGNIPRHQAEKFSWEIVAEEYEKLFQELA